MIVQVCTLYLFCFAFSVNSSFMNIVKIFKLY